MKRKRTNWQRFYEGQMKAPGFRALVEEELRALRIGVQIATLREKEKLSQTELAARAGMSAPNISRIENDPNPNLTVGRLARIARAMGYDVQIRFQRRRDAAKRSAGAGARAA